MTQPKTPEELNAEFVRIAADLGEGIAEAVAAAVAEERADVVAWLQAEAQRMYEAGQDRPAWFTLANRAERIERGEHRREEEK